MSVSSPQTLTVVYTDGACSGNPGPGGWAWAVPGGAWARGFDPDTTNQRMELMAVLRATEMLPGRLDVVTDSTYVANCFRDGWWRGWEKRGWKNSAKAPVANRDLWEPLIEAHKTGRFGVPRWVKGHSGDEMNDVVDRLAVTSARQGDDASGQAPPSEAETLAADSPRAKSSISVAGKLAELDPEQRRIERRRRDGRIPEGTLLVVGGMRSLPADLSPLRRHLTELIAGFGGLHTDLTVVSGLRPGAEQLGALAAQDAGANWVSVLPWPEPQRHMAQGERSAFEAMLASAPRVIVLEKKTPITRVDRAKSLARRDAWLAGCCDLAISVWDSVDDDGREFTVRFEKAISDDVIIVAP